MNRTGLARDMVSHHEIEPLRVVVGGLLFWLPGLAWTWVLLPRMPWPHRIPVSMVAAFTIQPMTLMALHLLFGVPINLEVGAFLAAALASAAIVVGLRRAFHRAQGDGVGLGR